MPVEFSRGAVATVASIIAATEESEGPWPTIRETVAKVVKAAVDAATAVSEDDIDADPQYHAWYCGWVAATGATALALASLAAGWTAMERLRPG